MKRSDARQTRQPALAPRLTDDFSRGVGILLLRTRTFILATLWIALLGLVPVLVGTIAWAAYRAGEGQWGDTLLWLTAWFFQDVIGTEWGSWTVVTNAGPEAWPTPTVRKSPWHIGQAEGFWEACQQGAIGGAVLMPFVWVGAAYLARRAGETVRDQQHLRGGQMVSEKQLAKLVEKGPAGADPLLRIGSVPFVKDTECQHCLFLGTTGAGKTTAIMRIMDVAARRGDAAVVYDVSGTLVERFYKPGRGDQILNPLDGRSPAWSPWAEMGRDADADRLAASLVPLDQGSNQFFSHAARALLSTALVRMRPEKDRSLYRLLDFMLTGSREEKEQFFAGTEAAKYFAEKADRAGASVDMNLATFLRALRFLPADSGGDQDFSVTRFMQQVDERRRPDERLPWIFLTSSQRDHEALRPLLTCWVDSAVSGLMGLGPRPDRRVWFFLDELFSLHEVPMLPRALAEGRKFGFAGVIGLQDTGQLNAIYGRDKARSMLSLLNTKALFRVGDSESAKWVSDLIGQAERERAEEAARYGAPDAAAGLNLSTRRGLEALVLAAEVTRLRDLECLLTLPGSWPVARIKIPRTSNAERPRIADPHKAAETSTTVAAKLNAKARPSAPAADGDDKAEEASKLSAAGILPGLHDTPAMRARLVEVQTARKAGQKIPPLHKDAIGGYAGLKPASPKPPADAAPQPETPAPPAAAEAATGTAAPVSPAAAGASESADIAASPAPAAPPDTAANGVAARAGSGPPVAGTNATLAAPTAAPAAPPHPQPLLSAASDPRFGF